MDRESRPARAGEAAGANPGLFEAVYERHGAQVLNLVYRMTGNEEVARDLAQDIWIKVFEHFDTFESRSEVFTWIHRIAVNHVLNHMRRERRVRWLRILDRPIGDVLRADEVSPDFDRAPEPGADHALETGERARRVWQAIQALDPKYRIPLVLHHYEEMSYQQVAETMQISLSAVESRIHRARKQLVRTLGPLLDEL
ncbi:MAG TPA: RNA polymerase sigma factor [Candidatus Krumholzibacteria bacterium]|nr:RNA polymerase sigma factor [Candidatus Krumholzibacteria bacterium]